MNATIECAISVRGFMFTVPGFGRFKVPTTRAAAGTLNFEPGTSNRGRSRRGRRIATVLMALAFFSAVLGAITWARAQQSARVFRIGILAYDQDRTNMEPFLEELNRLGYADKNARIEL